MTEFDPLWPLACDRFQDVFSFRPTPSALTGGSVRLWQAPAHSRSGYERAHE